MEGYSDENQIKSQIIRTMQQMRNPNNDKAYANELNKNIKDLTQMLGNKMMEHHTGDQHTANKFISDEFNKPTDLFNKSAARQAFWPGAGDGQVYGPGQAYGLGSASAEPQGPWLNSFSQRSASRLRAAAPNIKLPDQICQFMLYFCDFLDESNMFYQCYREHVEKFIKALNDSDNFIGLVTSMLKEVTNNCKNYLKEQNPPHIHEMLFGNNSESLTTKFKKEFGLFEHVGVISDSPASFSMEEVPPPPNYDILIDGLRYCCLLDKGHHLILPNADYMSKEALDAYITEHTGDLKKFIPSYHKYIFDEFMKRFLPLFIEKYTSFDDIHKMKRDRNAETIHKFNARKNGLYKSLYDNLFFKMTESLITQDEYYSQTNAAEEKDTDKIIVKKQNQDQNDIFRQMFIYLINNIKTYFVLPQRKKSLQFFNMLDNQHRLNRPGGEGSNDDIEQSQMEIAPTSRTFVGVVPDIERGLYQLKKKTFRSVDDTLLDRDNPFISVDANDIILNAERNLMAGNQTPQQLAVKRANDLHINDDGFMQNWFRLKNLIMNQLDLMHDIVIGDAGLVWDPLAQIYDDLISRLSDNKTYEEHFNKIKYFKTQMGSCWSNTQPRRANQERIKTLRGEMNDYVIQLLGLPVEDFKSQTLTRDEADADFLNICGKNMGQAIAYIESGRAIFFSKIKKRLDKLDETDINEFAQLLDKEGNELLLKILHDEIVDEVFYKKTNFNGLLDACISTVDKTEIGPKTIEFKKMFGKFTYSVTSDRPSLSGEITAKDMGHLVVVTDTYEPSITYAIYGLVGVASINSLTGSFKLLGGKTNAARGDREGESNIFNGDIDNFCSQYGFNPPNVQSLSLIQHDGICAYFRDVRDDNYWGLLTYGIKTICDEVIDAHIDRVDNASGSASIRAAFTIDALVSQTMLAKWLEGYYVTLPHVFRSSGLSYVLHSGRAEEDLKFVAKKLVIKILSYYQIAINLYPQDSQQNRQFNESASLVLSSIAGKNAALTADKINRIHNLITDITHLAILKIPLDDDDDIYDKCYAAIMQKHAISFLEKLKQNVTAMISFLSNFSGEVVLLRTDLDSLAGYESLLRFDIVNQYMIGESSFDFDEFVGFTSADVFEVSDVTPQNITFYIKGKHDFNNLITKLNDIPEFDTDEFKCDCQVKISGRYSGASSVTFFYKMTYTYTIEFLIEVLKFNKLRHDLRVKIVYLVLKHLFDNYNMAGSDQSFDETFLKYLNEFITYAGASVAIASADPPPPAAVSAAAVSAAPPLPPDATLLLTFKSIADVSTYLDSLFNTIEFSGNATTCGDNREAAAGTSAVTASATEVGVEEEVLKHCPNDIQFQNWVVSQPIKDEENNVIHDLDVKYENPVKEAPDSNNPDVNVLRRRVSEICNPKTDEPDQVSSPRSSSFNSSQDTDFGTQKNGPKYTQEDEFNDKTGNLIKMPGSNVSFLTSVSSVSSLDSHGSDEEQTDDYKEIIKKRTSLLDNPGNTNNKRQYKKGGSRLKQTKGRKMRIKKFTRGLKKKTVKRKTKKHYRKKYNTIRNKIKNNK